MKLLQKTKDVNQHVDNKGEQPMPTNKKNTNKGDIAMPTHRKKINKRNIATNCLVNETFEKINVIMQTIKLVTQHVQIEKTPTKEMS